jgi:hypothetical protein
MGFGTAQAQTPWRGAAWINQLQAPSLSSGHALTDCPESLRLAALLLALAMPTLAAVDIGSRGRPSEDFPSPAEDWSRFTGIARSRAWATVSSERFSFARPSTRPSERCGASIVPGGTRHGHGTRGSHQRGARRAQLRAFRGWVRSATGWKVEIISDWKGAADSLGWFKLPGPSAAARWSIWEAEAPFDHFQPGTHSRPVSCRWARCA